MTRGEEMDFIDKLKNGVKPQSTTEDIYYSLTQDIKNMKSMSESEQKQVLLKIMSFTGSWIRLEDLKKILTDEDFA